MTTTDQVCSFLTSRCTVLFILRVEGFIIEDPDDAEDASRRHYPPRQNTRKFDEDDESPEQIAQALSQRYINQRALPYSGDMNEVPQRLLMPSVHDASLWQVRVKASFMLFRHFDC